MPAFICNTCGTQYAPTRQAAGGLPDLRRRAAVRAAAGPELDHARRAGQAQHQRLARARAEPAASRSPRPGLRHRPARAALAHAARQHPVGLHLADRPRHRRADQRPWAGSRASRSRTRTTTPAWSEWSQAFGGIPIHLHAADRKWIMRDDPAIALWQGETKELLPGADADLRRRPLSRRHGAALGGGRRRQGRAAVGRHRAGGAGQQVGELHVELPELHPAVGAARRGRGRRRSSPTSSTACTAPSPTAPSGPTARPWSSARPSAI